MDSENKDNKPLALDDEQRVKVMSPTMLVVKRFVRNKLAIIGLVIIICMFIFSFVGGLISPYGEVEVFNGYENLEKIYASLMVNTELRYYEYEGFALPLSARAQFIRARSAGNPEFEHDGVQYSFREDGDELYQIFAMRPMAEVRMLAAGETVLPAEGSSYTDALFTVIYAEAQNARSQGESEFTVDGQSYAIREDRKSWSFGPVLPVALATSHIFDMYDAQQDASPEFMHAVGLAQAAGQSSFKLDGGNYILEQSGDSVIVSLNSQPFAAISDFVVQPFAADIRLSMSFKEAAKEAVLANQADFMFSEDGGEEIRFSIARKDKEWTLYTLTNTLITRRYEAPSTGHWLGIDGDGMDMLTRIMYGGRISLMIGFIVVFLELFIGVILGGIAGYFGGWLDNLIMRIVDIFNCIPSLPILIIIGAVFDDLQLDPRVRIFALMFILGILGWTGIARVVRGQILSLREQEFMVAAEATGIAPVRRIFRHLVPNVVPQLIVFATMGLGGVILTEATLSFLGLGVKYPLASWGNIMNSVTNNYIMTTYWLVWIPAGICMLLTVLGFNFIGDGLRDAFDPKMKR